MRDHDLARQAVARGQALPLADILPTVREASPGEVLDVQLGRLPSGRLVYDVTVLARDGRYRTVRVDAMGNRILESGTR